MLVVPVRDRHSSGSLPSRTVFRTGTERFAGHAPEAGHVPELVRPSHVTQTLGAAVFGSAVTTYLFRRFGGPPPGTVHTARTEAGQHNRSPSQTGRRPLQGRTLRERHHRSDGRTCRGDRCRARHGRLRACHRCRLPAAPRYRPRRHGAGRAAAGRNRPRHQGHRADAQEPADRGHQGRAGWGAPAKAETATETKPKRRATSKTRTGDETVAPAEQKAEKVATEKAVAQQQIDIPGQPAGALPARAKPRAGETTPPSSAVVAVRPPRPAARRRSPPRRRTSPRPRRPPQRRARPGATRVTTVTGPPGPPRPRPRWPPGPPGP